MYYPDFRLSKTVLFLITFLFTLSLQAQPPIQIPTTQPGGAIQINSDQGAPQLSSLLEDKNRAGGDVNASLNKNATRVNRDSLTKDNIKERETAELATYGQNVFGSASVTDLSELSTPPLDYPIGVGDNIIVSMWGGAEYQNIYEVARDGSIFPRSLGKIIVQGLTFEVARDMIIRRFMTVVPPQTNIAVSIGQPRTISVNVVGEVNNPGPHTVSAFTNAFNVIGLAGGVNEYGDLRRILVMRGHVIIDSLDVYRYLTNGDLGKHIYMENNDVVVVGKVQKKVLATGQFKRPMYYQLKADEGIRALLLYSGGMNADALGSSMKILRSENETQVQKDINAAAIMKGTEPDFILMDGDIAKLDLIKTGLANKVTLKGEVKYEGNYELRKNDRLFDVINRAGGVTRNTYLGRAYIFRGAGDSTNLKSDKLEVNLEDLVDSTGGYSSANNYILYPNDIIQLFNVNDFADPQYVEIYGEVRKEGRVRKYGGMTLEDLLFLAGGIKPTAEFGRLEVSSIVDVDSAKQGLKPTRTVVRQYAIENNLLADSSAKQVLLRPYDQVFVRRNPTFEFQQNIEIKGQVKYAGLYPRLSKNERLSSYIERAGGILENANLDGAIMFRKQTNVMEENLVTKNKLDKEKLDTTLQSTIVKDSARSTTVQPNFNEFISIDLRNALMYKNSQRFDPVLQDGDIVVIPEIDPFVAVTGQVQSPVKMAFDKQNSRLGYYIDKAGGFSERPWKRRIFVKYANGKSRRTHNFLFINFYPRVEQGSVITVPYRPRGQDVVDFMKSLIVTSIPIVTTILITKYIK